MKEKAGNRSIVPILAALFSAGLLGVVYVIRGFYPFGSGTIAQTDLYSQYLPLLYRFYDVITGRKNLFIDFSMAGGINLYIDTINEVINPFNYILFLFGREKLYLAVNVLLLCYAGAAAATAVIALQRLFPAGPGTDRRLILLLGTCYSLSGFAAYNYQIIKWMYPVVLFPLFAIAFMKLMRGGNGTAYALLAAYQLMLSVQLGFMALLFALFASGIYLFTSNALSKSLDKNHSAGTRKRNAQEHREFSQSVKHSRSRIAASLGLHTIFGILLSAVVLIPNIYLLLSSARSGELFSYLGLMQETGLFDIADRLFNTVHPVLLALAVLQYCRLKKQSKLQGKDPEGEAVKRTEWRFWFLLCVFLLLTVLLQPANLLWHMGSYICFPVRYGYMILFAGCCLIAAMHDAVTDGYNNSDAINTDSVTSDAGNIVAVIVSALLCAAAVLLTIRYEDRITQAFSSLVLTNCPAEARIVAGIVGLLFLAAVFAGLTGPRKQWLLFITAGCAGVCVFLFIFLPQDYSVRQMNEQAYIEMTRQYTEAGERNYSEELSEWKLSDLADEDGNEDTLLPRDAALVNGTHTLTSYVPTLAAKTQNTLQQLGYEVYWVATTGKGGSEYSKELLTHAHMIGEENVESVSSANRIGFIVDERTGRIVVKANAGERELIQLPFINIDGWSCAIDDKNADIQDVFDGLIAIEAGEGENTAVFSFLPPGLITGATASLAGVIVLLIASHLMYGSTIASRIMNALYLLILIGALTGIYILPAAGLAWNTAARFSSAIPAVEEVSEKLSGFVKSRLSGNGTAGSGSGENTSKNDAGRSHLVVAEEFPEGISVSVFDRNLLQQSGVKMSADSEENKNLSAALAADGITGENSLRWSSSNDRGSCDHWIMAKLPERAEVGLIRIFWERTNASQYAIEVSEDGKTWQAAAEFTEPAAEPLQEILLDQPAVCSYVRLHITDVLRNEEDLTLYYQNVSVLEMEVYGAASENFMIEKPQIISRAYENTAVDEEISEQRYLTMPAVPKGFDLEWIGADYEMLIDEDMAVADTIAPVEIETGFALLYEGERTELPGMYLVIPSSLNSFSDQNLEETTLFSLSHGNEESPADSAILTNNEAEQELKIQNKDGMPEVAEWLPQGKAMNLESGEFSIYISSGKTAEPQDPETEILNEMAELLSEEICSLSVDAGFQVQVSELALEDFPVAEVSGGEGYNIDLLTDGHTIRIYGNTAQGVRWGCVTVLDMIRKACFDHEGVLQPGYIRDYPRYSVRGFNIDVGRRPVSMDLLRQMVHALSAQKMNTLQIHLNDNEIISSGAEHGYDGTVESARKLYSGFRLESDIRNDKGEGITSEDQFYTKEEFRELIAEAKIYGVDIVPEIDMPAHCLAVTKIFPELGFSNNPEGADELDLSRPEATEFAKAIWSEYLGGFVFSGCDTIHIGMDEYFGKGEDYIRFLNDVSAYVHELAPDKKIRIWGSLTYIGADYSGVSRELEMQIWDTLWTNPQEMYEAGFPLINSISSSLYIIPGGGYDYLDIGMLTDVWEPCRLVTREKVWQIPAYSPRMLGAVYSMWNDHNIGSEGTITEEGLFDRFVQPLDILAEKLW